MLILTIIILILLLIAFGICHIAELSDEEIEKIFRNYLEQKKKNTN